jgi:hypothetical protein
MTLLRDDIFEFFIENMRLLMFFFDAAPNVKKLKI